MPPWRLTPHEEVIWLDCLDVNTTSENMWEISQHLSYLHQNNIQGSFQVTSRLEIQILRTGVSSLSPMSIS